MVLGTLGALLEELLVLRLRPSEVPAQILAP